MKSVKVRTKCKIVGSDYSGQELRLAAYLSQDKTLLDAYATNRDAYSIIASMIFDMPYEDCLEFYKPGSIVEIDGKKVVSGTGKEEQVEVDDQTGITTLYYNILKTESGDVAVQDLKIGDKIKADDGWLIIIDKQAVDEQNIKLMFKKC